MTSVEYLGQSFSRAPKYQAPVHGKRGQPTTQQAVVVINNFYESDIDNRSTDESKTWGTYTDNKAVMSVQPFEWVVFRPNENFGRNLPNSTVDMTPVNAFSCVNGLLKTDEIRFMGLCLNPSASNNTNKGEDDYGVTQVSGTHTGYNTGAETIQPFDLVYWIPEPYCRVDENGRKMPMIDMEGFGYPKDKLMGQVITIKGKDASRQSAFVNSRLSDVIDKHTSNSSKGAIDAFRQVLKESKIREGMPLYEWGLLEGAYLAMEKYRYLADEVARRTKIETFVIPLVFAVLKQVYDKIDKQHRKYTKNLGEEWVSPQSMDLNAADFLDEARHNAFFKEASVKLRRAQHHKYNEHMDWLQATYVGMALNLSPSGMPLDILLRAGRG